MIKVKKIVEGDLLLRVKLYNTGTNSWELRVISGRTGLMPVSTIKVQGDNGDLRKVLMKLKAADAASTPATKRHLAYSTIVSQAEFGSDNEVWVRQSLWNAYKGANE